MSKKSFKLPEPFLTNWKKALRSGEYKQAEGRLLTNKVLQEFEDYDEEDEDIPDFDPALEKMYCCLGVAGKICDVDDLHMYNVEVFDNNISELSLKKIPEGLDNSPHNNKLVNILTSLNDGVRRESIKTMVKEGAIFRKELPKDDFPQKFSFEEIADWLDDNVEGTRTSDEWCRLKMKEKPGFVIMDPDGWDRTNYDFSFNQEMITKEEFDNRVGKSTCINIINPEKNG